MEQIDLASSVNLLLVYASRSSFTLRSTSSLFTFSLRFRNGGRPDTISYMMQPSPHQSGDMLYRSLRTTSGAEKKNWSRLVCTFKIIFTDKRVFAIFAISLLLCWEKYTLDYHSLPKN